MGGKLTETLVNSAWVLMSAALIFMMQPGFMCVEAGLTRSKNNISVAIKNIADFSVSILIYWCIGYAIMFGASQNGLFGTTNFAFGTLPDAETYVHFIFQAMFCGTAATILSGAVAERCGFAGYLLITALTAALIYPMFGHWAWYAGETQGWLASLGYYDFAGAGVVHAVGGGVALAAILVIGPRKGRFLEAGKSRRFNGSNLPLSMLGILLLWFGWFGFNGGSAMGLTEAVPAILLNTFVAGAAGVLVGLGLTWALDGKPSVFFAMNGSLAGLVAITAAADLVTVAQAILIGGIGSAIAYSADLLLERLSIDDAVGAVPVHFGAGLWGLLAVAVFGQTDLGFGAQLYAQAIAIVTLAVFAVGLPYAILFAIDRVFPLRVTDHVEEIGLNVGEHGANTDLNELFDVMQRQARDRDLSLRVPQSPFTEVGQIGLFYNSVIFELERSFTRLQETSAQMAEVAEQKDALLESVLPKRIAERMNDGEDRIVDQVTDATVVFADIVDFTTYAMEHPPEESVGLLKDLFGRYDEIMGRYGLEKIKTIGDCYMFVSGVTSDQQDHCAMAIDAAMDMLFETRQLSTHMGRDVKVRIGVHSGPLVAGVVGDLRFVYDLWGATVNIASRIEEAGKPDKITVSQAVIDRIGTEFVYQRQARVRLRGIGSSVLYSIEKRRASVAAQ